MNATKRLGSVRRTNSPVGPVCTARFHSKSRSVATFAPAIGLPSRSTTLPLKTDGRSIALCWK